MCRVWSSVDSGAHAANAEQQQQQESGTTTTSSSSSDDNSSISVVLADEAVGGLPLPAQRYMPRLHMKEKIALRSRANALAAEGRIPRVNCGTKGITSAFLNSCADTLGRNELVRAWERVHACRMCGDINLVT